MCSVAPCDVTDAPDACAAGSGILPTGPDRESQKHPGDVSLTDWEHREVAETAKQEKELDWGTDFKQVTSQGEEFKLSHGLLLCAKFIPSRNINQAPLLESGDTKPHIDLNM